MAYATVDDMIRRFGEREMIELTDRINLRPEGLGKDIIVQAIADADAAIDGYVGKVYRLPLRGCAKPPAKPGAAPQYVPPPQLTRLSCDLARYYLYDDLAPEAEVYRRYKNALKELDAIAAGEAQLSCPWGGEPGELVASTSQTGQDVQHEFAPRRVTDDTLKGF